MVLDPGAVDLKCKDVTSYKPTGSFKVDYLALCEKLQLVPHPCVLPSSPGDEDSSTEELNITNKSSNENGDAEEGCCYAPDRYDMTESDVISVRNVELDSGHLKLLLHVIQLCPAVTNLALHSAGLSPEGVRFLAEALPMAGLETLAVDFNPLLEEGKGEEAELDDQAAAAGAQAGDASSLFSLLLGAPCTQRSLSLRGCGISDSGAVALSAALEGNIALCTLNLFGNRIGDRGAAALVESLKLNTCLNGLSLASNRVGCDTLGKFSELFVGGYGVDETLQRKREERERDVAAFEKAAEGAGKKKKGGGGGGKGGAAGGAGVAAVAPGEIPPLAAMSTGEGGRMVAAGNRSLAVLNLSDNRYGEKENVEDFLKALAQPSVASELRQTLRAIYLQHSGGASNLGLSDELEALQPALVVL